MIGQSYSTSRNACHIQFVGGPWDGQSRLFDTDRYDAIGVSNSLNRRTFSYKRFEPKRFCLDSVYEWDGQP